jgi:tetratricopeptide (TPR) repeat protein
MTKFEHRTQASAYKLMKATFACSAVLFLSVVAAHARTVEMTLHQAKATEAAKEYRLLPKPEELTDGDAVPLYQQAIKSLPDEYPRKKFSEWRGMPPYQLPAAQVKTQLEKLKPTLDLVNRATRCKLCNWPSVAPGQVSQQVLNELSKYRELAFILDVQVKIQIAEGQYEQAIESLKTTLAMARHLGEAPTLAQGMVGIAIAALSLKESEQLIQSADSPSLYWAMRELKLPLVDLTKTMDLEIANLENYNFILRRQFRKQLKPAHDRIRVQMNYLDRRVAGLQCVEALRIYAGAHEGRFPDKLSDLTEATVPDDPVTATPFSYSRTDSTAVLETPGTEGAEGRDEIRYELNLKK